MNVDGIRQRFTETLPACDWATVRYMEEDRNFICVRDDVVQPLDSSLDAGVMVTVSVDGGVGYASTSDLGLSGLQDAAQKAKKWAQLDAQHGLLKKEDAQAPQQSGQYLGPCEKPWSSVSLEDKVNVLRDACERTQAEHIVERMAWLYNTNVKSMLLWDGGEIEQNYSILVPEIRATSNKRASTETRSFGGGRLARQGGLEILDQEGFNEAPERISAEAVELLFAPQCPEGEMDLLLAPDQMVLQIHESIGHPLELDRILGDERNYAGTSFVTMDMFGEFQYGSELLNISFNPSMTNEVASYAFDDNGTPAQKEFLIKNGILLRPLGSSLSQARADLPGVANARACSWKRPPIDRMANLNLESGDNSFDELVAQVEKGVYMESNCSWSIDDSRNKFQFGCERAQLIENGELKGVVRRPNYRGISSSFWRSLKGVGNDVRILGTPNCGKGEPNQLVRVGHATPHALFSNVEVFGGEA